MRYFITGTAGFIGFHLAQRLLSLGHNVFGFDGMTPCYDVTLKQMRHVLLETSDKFHAVIGMLEDRQALSDAMKEAQADIIIHLAGQAGVRRSLEQPEVYVDTNIKGSWNLIDLCREMKPNI